MARTADDGGLTQSRRVRSTPGRGEVDRLVAAHGGEMTRLCYVICGDAELARDAVQDAWQRYWQD